MEVLTDHLREVPVPYGYFKVGSELWQQLLLWCSQEIMRRIEIQELGRESTVWVERCKTSKQWPLLFWCFFCRTPMLSSKICPTYAWLALVALAMWGVASWSWAQVMRKNMKLCQLELSSSNAKEHETVKLTFCTREDKRFLGEARWRSSYWPKAGFCCVVAKQEKRKHWNTWESILRYALKQVKKAWVQMQLIEISQLTFGRWMGCYQAKFVTTSESVKWRLCLFASHFKVENVNSLQRWTVLSYLEDYTAVGSWSLPLAAWFEAAETSICISPCIWRITLSSWISWTRDHGSIPTFATLSFHHPLGPPLWCQVRDIHEFVHFDGIHHGWNLATCHQGGMFQWFSMFSFNLSQGESNLLLRCCLLSLSMSVT